MYTFVLKQTIIRKNVLVAGCGFGDDAIRLAKLGAHVYAFDLSPESLNIASTIASREGVHINFQEMPIEHLEYKSDFFDFIIARDILHHADIPNAMREFIRVSHSETLLVINEIYSHSLTN